MQAHLWHFIEMLKTFTFSFFRSFDFFIIVPKCPNKSAIIGTTHLFLFFDLNFVGNHILLWKLFWPTLRKKCSTDQEFFFENSRLKAQNLQKKNWSLEEFIQTDKGQKKFASRTLFNLLFEVPIWYYIIYVKVGFFA